MTMKQILKIENVKKDNEVFTLHVYDIGRTCKDLIDKWAACDPSHIDAVESEDGLFYRSLDENIEELMESFNETREEVKSSTLRFLLEEALRNRAYSIYYDKFNKDGNMSEANVKFRDDFEWCPDAPEDLDERALRLFAEISI